MIIFALMKIKQNIPNAITCGNLLCGCLALVKAFEGDLVWAAYLVGIAVVLDFLDGFVARMLNVTSAIGKDLDSLADMVTFGVVPGVVMYKLLFQANVIYDAKELLPAPDTIALCYEKGSPVFCYLAFVLPVFSAIRLAKFNNDSRQSNSFIGLPTPANAILICSFPLILNRIGAGQNLIVDTLNNPYILITASCLLSFLLVAPLPLFALKFKHFNWKENEIRYIFLGLAVVLIATLQFVGIPLTIILYILLSVINNLFKKRDTSSN